jgi:hypothetical protein
MHLCGSFAAFEKRAVRAGGTALRHMAERASFLLAHGRNDTPTHAKSIGAHVQVLHGGHICQIYSSQRKIMCPSFVADFNGIQLQNLCRKSSLIQLVLICNDQLIKCKLNSLYPK